MRSGKCDAKALFTLTLLLPGMAIAAEKMPFPSPRQDLGMISLAVPKATATADQSHASSDTTNATLAAPADVTAPRQAKAEEVNGIGAAIATDKLESYRGGSEVSNTALSDGLVQDTTAINIATGKNSISDGAFAYSSGLPIVIQNSGANVLIQNSTIINVQFK